MWFHYSQNNSGGNFVYDAKSGITHHVVIEAKNASAADNRSQKTILLKKENRNDSKITER